MDTFLGWNAKEQKVDPVSMKGRDGVSEWKWNLEKLIGGLGDNYKIMECSMKAFPTEALTHTHLSASFKRSYKNNITYDQIETVTLTTLAQAYDILLIHTSIVRNQEKLQIIHCPIALRSFGRSQSNDSIFQR